MEFSEKCLRLITEIQDFSGVEISFEKTPEDWLANSRVLRNELCCFSNENEAKIYSPNGNFRSDDVVHELLHIRANWVEMDVTVMTENNAVMWLANDVQHLKVIPGQKEYSEDWNNVLKTWNRRYLENLVELNEKNSQGMPVTMTALRGYMVLSLAVGECDALRRWNEFLVKVRLKRKAKELVGRMRSVVNSQETALKRCFQFFQIRNEDYRLVKYDVRKKVKVLVS